MAKKINQIPSPDIKNLEEYAEEYVNGVDCNHEDCDCGRCSRG